MNRDRENLRKLIHETGFETLEASLLASARPSIRVYTERVADDAALPLGRSKIGGRPDLPKQLEWATVVTSDQKRHHLPFIAQLNLADVKPFDEENLLPESGILYFFADPLSGFAHADEGRVLYFDGDLSMLERKDFPADIPFTPPNEWGERYDACALTFVPEVNLPFSDDMEYPAGKTWIDFDNLVSAASYTETMPPFSRAVNRLLGYNYDVPQDLQLDCQLIADTGMPYNATPEQRQQAEARKSDWQLLFQIDSDENAGMMWNDAGIIAFFVRRNDLQNRDFSQACLAFFSS